MWLLGLHQPAAVVLLAGGAPGEFSASSAGTSSDTATVIGRGMVRASSVGTSTDSANVVDGNAVATTLDVDFAGCNVDGTASTIDDATTSTPTLNITPRTPDDVDWQQCLIAADGVTNKTITVDIDLVDKETDNTFDAAYTGPWYAFDLGGPWTNQTVYTDSAGHLIFDVPCGANARVYVATIPPLTEDTALAWIQDLETANPTLIHDDLPARLDLNDGAYVCGRSGTGIDENSRSISNRPMYGFRVSDDTTGAQSPNAKRTLIVQCGVHCGEWNGWHWLQGFMEEWLATPALLEHFDLVVYPLVSILGNYLGFRRNEAASPYSGNLDLNREFFDGDGSLDTVVRWQKILDRNHGVHLHNVVGAYDFHDGSKTGANGKAWHIYPPGMTDQAAISALLTDEDPELNGVVSVLDGTTQYYFADEKGINIVFTFEVRDELSTIPEVRGYGAATARATNAMRAGGYMNAYLGKAIGDPQPESFESGFGDWTNPGPFSWTRTNTATPTTGTGADVASDGSYFLFTEATGQTAGDEFILERTGINLLTAVEMQFDFERFGCVGGSLNVDVDDGSGYTTVWTNTTNYAAVRWKNEGVDLSAFTDTSGSIRFRGVMGGTPIGTNDNSVDNIRLFSELPSGVFAASSAGASTDTAHVIGRGMVRASSAGNSTDAVTAQGIGVIRSSSAGVSSDTATVKGRGMVRASSVGTSTDTVNVENDTGTIQASSAGVSTDNVRVIGRGMVRASSVGVSVDSVTFAQENVPVPNPTTMFAPFPTYNVLVA